MTFGVNTVLVSVGEIPSSGMAGHKMGECLPLVDAVNCDCISFSVVLFFLNTLRSLLCTIFGIDGGAEGGINKIAS